MIDSRSCLQARRTLSVVLDGEASATEVAETAQHLPECEHCARFAAAVAELKLYIRAYARKQSYKPDELIQVIQQLG